MVRKFLTKTVSLADKIADGFYSLVDLEIH